MVWNLLSRGERSTLRESADRLDSFHILPRSFFMGSLIRGARSEARAGA